MADSGGKPRYLGLDVGNRRIGVAVSDELGLTAQPVLTLERKPGRREDLRSLARLCRRFGVAGIVVGNPLHLDGGESPQAVKTRAFAAELGELTGLPVQFWDERLTTREAHQLLYEAGRKRQEHRGVVDQVAATMILQGFLERNNDEQTKKGMPSMPAPYAPTWTTEGPNILAESNLERIRQALSEGWIGGIHLYYAGGCSGDPVAFSTYGAFLSHVNDSRPGDLFILWSVAEVRRKGFLLADRRYQDAGANGGSLLSPVDLDRVRGYLAEGALNEILSIASAEGDELEADWTDLDGSHEGRFFDMVRRAAVPGSAIFILPLTRIDSPEFYLIKAKRPNEKGEVPLDGAY